MILIIVIFIVIYVVVKNRSKKSNTDHRNKVKTVNINHMPKIPYPPHHNGICSAAKVKKSNLDALGLEDRENDWFAKQLKEEAKLKQRMYSDMALLKKEHAAVHRSSSVSI